MSDIVEIIGVLIGFCLVVGIPAIAIMTSHQRKMAELMHKQQGSPQNNEVLQRLDSMQQQMNEMQNRQNELILQKHEQSPPPTPNVQDRIQD